MRSNDWLSMSLEQWVAWPRLLKASSIFTVSVFLLGYFFFVSKAFHDLCAQKKEAIGLKSALITRQERSLTRLAYRQQLALLQAHQEENLSQSSEENWTSQILEMISKVSESLGVHFKLFAPEKTRDHGLYCTLTLKIIVIGTYRQLALLMSQLAKLRLMAIHSFSMQPQAQSPDTLDRVLLMHMTLIFYRYPES